MQVQSTLSGTVIEMHVAVGSPVEAGQQLMVVESMKMEIPVESPVAGSVTALPVGIGAFVGEGDLLAEIE